MTRSLVDLNQYSFEESSRMKGKICCQKKVELDFINHVEETLNTYTCIDKFKLLVKFSLVNREEGDVYIHRWINHAINNNVKDLSFSYLTNISCSSSLDKVWRHVLPDSLYRCTSLESLDLFRCTFMKPGLGCGITLSLRKLSPCKVTIDQETLQSLIWSCCASLEELSIELCHGFDVVRVSAGDKLESVQLYLYRNKSQIVGIWAPNLRRLSYAGGFKNVQDSFLSSGEFDNVEELKFHDISLEPESLQIIQDFPALQKLELQRCGREYKCQQLNREQIVSLIQTFS